MQIIEEDVNADELCTRREYARWLVRINSLLERYKRIETCSKYHAYLFKACPRNLCFDLVGIQSSGLFHPNHFLGLWLQLLMMWMLKTRILSLSKVALFLMFAYNF